MLGGIVVLVIYEINILLGVVVMGLFYFIDEVSVLNE